MNQNNKEATGPTNRKGQYAKVDTQEHNQNAFEDENEEFELTERQIKALKREARKRKWVRRFHMVNDRGQALCWITACAFMIYKTNFFRQVWENPHKVTFFFDLAMIGIGINIAFMLYMTVYLPYIKRINEDFETYCPQLIPVVTVIGIVSFFSLLIALWPIWGWLTPIMMFILFMGYTMLLMFLPGGFLGTIIFWIMMFAMATVSHLIPHDPDSVFIN
eukprot:403338390